MAKKISKSEKVAGDFFKAVLSDSRKPESKKIVQPVFNDNLTGTYFKLNASLKKDLMVHLVNIGIDLKDYLHDLIVTDLASKDALANYA